MPVPLPRARILNVDDDEMCRYAVTRILQHNDFEVTEASNGADALRFAASQLPDVVLLDVNLPDIDGFEVCRRLKAAPATARIPVMHITASSVRGTDMARGLECGADSYLTEPVEPEVLIATIRSVLRARRAEEAAHTLARQWQSTFDAMSDGVAVAGGNGEILLVNQNYAALTGQAPKDLIGQSSHQIWGSLPEEQRPFFRAGASRRRETVDVEHEGRWYQISFDPIFNEDDGRFAGGVQIVRDITETRRLEEQFRESQKFETVGTLAAGVAHDFNNLLTSMMGNASLILGELPPESPFRERLDDVLNASQRAAELTRQLLAYSGKGRHAIQKVGMSGLISRIQHLIEAAVPKKVTLAVNLASGLPPIEADPSEIQQVVMNLVNNAAEAVGEASGTIVVSTGVEDGSVWLQVRDTGSGMDEATKARMFDPFFTTKFTGRGLGLAAVAGIARTHKASIEVTSAPGRGCTVRLRFPAVAQPAPKQPEAATGPTGATCTVLVVDDEDIVRRIAQATLEIRGYKVLVAADGREAIRRVQESPEIQVVLLDLTMPVMGGEEAIDGITAAHPGVKVIVSTGYDQHDAAARFINKAVAGFLQKPYTSRQLNETIRAALGR